jgi:hypothetical protein
MKVTYLIKYGLFIWVFFWVKNKFILFQLKYFTKYLIYTNWATVEPHNYDADGHEAGSQRSLELRNNKKPE